MPQTNITLRIDGMTCVNCENKIEKGLVKISGVMKVRASYSNGTAKITFDSAQTSLPAIKESIEALGYKTTTGEDKAAPSHGLMKAAGIAVLLFAVFMLARHLGLLDFFNRFPEAEAGMSYGMLFVIGLLTSVHCIAMCGGINLSQCIPHAARSKENSGRPGSLRSGFLYNLGRVASYTLIGGVVGAAGSVVSFSGAARGIVQLAAGVFMVVMGLNMLNVFPWLRRVTPRIPKIFARGINHGKRGNSPLYIGLLNGLMPCGPLQAMQLYALSTGDPFKGALSMLLFSLGTVPLMFGLGALSSIVSRRFTQKMMTAGAALVIVLGASMFGNGMRLSGAGAPLPPAATSEGSGVEVAEEVQRVTTQLSRRGYEPITVTVGIPVEWTIHAEQGTVNGCNNRIIIPEYGYLEKKLVVGDNVIEFTPTKTGTFSYSCWMGMIYSSITVVDGGASGV